MALVLSIAHAEACPYLLEGLPAPFPRSIPIEIYNAVESKAEISFRQTRKRCRASARSITPVKGYEVEPDQYVILEPSEIDAVKLQSKKTIDLVQFVDASDIDSRYFERPAGERRTA